MENKAHALAAGIFVTVVTALLVALAAWLTRQTGERHIYEISTHASVTGLQSQATVRYRGVDVGKVDSIGFDPKSRGNVLIRMEIDKDAPMNRDTFATLNYQGVTGLAFVQLDDTGKPAPPLPPDDANPPRIPLKPGLLATLTERGGAILDRVDEATTRINQLLGEQNQQRFTSALQHLDSAGAGATRLTQHLDRTLTTRIDPALAQANRTMQSVRRSADEIGRSAADFGRTAQRLNAKDGPMDRLAQGTEALSHAADTFNASTLPRINRVTEETSRAVRRLGRTATSIGENPQSLLYGTGQAAPGPGEPGFTPPGAAR
ncbi:MAG TPA: MlaD family protein [Ramlibacter sp.]|nr:MlaD family protein [Ramlibacter sp.]